MKIRILSAALVTALIAGVSVSADAQQNMDDGFQPRDSEVVFDRLPLFGDDDASDSVANHPADRSVEVAKPAVGAAAKAADQASAARPQSLRRAAAWNSSDSQRRLAAELRQQRALYHMWHSMARMERNAWIGHSPLRPTISGNPMTTGRYEHPRLVIVPAYVIPR